MPNWKAPLAFEDASGRYPARFDLEASGYVRCRIYGQRFAPLAFQNTWWSNIKVDKASGASLTANWPGRIINVPADLLGDTDPETGQPKLYTLEQAAKILGVGAPAQTDQIVKVHLTVERASGKKDVVGSLAV